ncbi:hypothetical protein Hanom_Chr10g00928161 [Helianthus anomalus]
MSHTNQSQPPVVAPPKGDSVDEQTKGIYPPPVDEQTKGIYPPSVGYAPPGGYPQQGYATAGYPSQGYPPQGYAQGYPPQGYPPQGYPQGYPPQGYPPHVYPPHPQYTMHYVPPQQHYQSSGFMEGWYYCSFHFFRSKLWEWVLYIVIKKDCIIISMKFVK